MNHLSDKKPTCQAYPVDKWGAKKFGGALSTLPSFGIEPGYSRATVTFWNRALGKVVG